LPCSLSAPEPVGVVGLRRLGQSGSPAAPSGRNLLTLRHTACRDTLGFVAIRATRRPPRCRLLGMFPEPSNEPYVGHDHLRQRGCVNKTAPLSPAGLLVFASHKSSTCRSSTSSPRHAVCRGCTRRGPMANFPSWDLRRGTAPLPWRFSIFDNARHALPQVQVMHPGEWSRGSRRHG
jgi:hypothetical protein